MAKKKNWIVSLKIAKVFNGMGFFENINNPIRALVILSNICLNVVLYNGPKKLIILIQNAQNQPISTCTFLFSF